MAVNYQIPWNLFANRKHHSRILNPGSSIVVLQEVLLCLQNIKIKQKYCIHRSPHTQLIITTTKWTNKTKSYRFLNDYTSHATLLAYKWRV